MLRKWEELPEFMKNEEVKEYYYILKNRRKSLFLKRIFDILLSFISIIILSAPMIIIAIIIKIDSKGPVFYRQERVTSFGKKFKIHKFRTMVLDADKIGESVTTFNDSRITNVGKILRNYRFDEFPQLFDVLSGNMSFVGTRPEIVKYVDKYSKEMLATLLLPAGITSEASINYKNESTLLDIIEEDIDKVYIERILPEKMKYNLESIKNFSFMGEIIIIFKTIFCLLK